MGLQGLGAEIGEGARGKDSSVSFLDSLYEPHLGRMQSSLKRTTIRHQALVGNLANINTPGYKRRDADFTVPLDEAESRFPRLRAWAKGSGSMQSDDVSIRMDGSSVDLEREVFSIAETELRYQIVTDMVGRYFSGMKNVIKEGR